MAKELKIKIYSQNGNVVKETELNPEIFGVAVKESVVHQVAVAQMANARVAIADTKDRSEVRGGGKKPWRQKGTGRARQGSIRSPLWKGGGVVFGPKSARNFSQKINKKMKRKALFMCLSDKVNNNFLVVIDQLKLTAGKTKEIIEVVKSFKEILKLKQINRKNKFAVVDSAEVKQDLKKENKKNSFDIKKYKMSLLVVLPQSHKDAKLALRNLVGVKMVLADSLNVWDLLHYEKVLMPEECLDIFEKTYLKKVKTIK